VFACPHLQTPPVQPCCLWGKGARCTSDYLWLILQFHSGNNPGRPIAVLVPNSHQPSAIFQLICLDDFSEDFSHFPPPDALLRVCSFVRLRGCFVVSMLSHFLSDLRIYANVISRGNWSRPLL